MSECVSSIGFETTPTGSWKWLAEASLAVLVAESVSRDVTEWTWAQPSTGARLAVLAYGDADAAFLVGDLLPPTPEERLDLAGCIQDGGNIENFSGLAAAFKAGPGPPGPRTPFIPKLGCGVYEAAIFERGGRRIVGQIPWTGIDWGRILNDTSTASLNLSGVSNAGAECCGIIAQIEPWEHELCVYRDTHQVWIGPIVDLLLDGDDVTIEARDVTAWWDRRWIHGDHDFSAEAVAGAPGALTNFVDLSTMFKVFADDAMAPDNSPRVCLEVTPTGVMAERYTKAAQHAKAGAILRELSRAGLDFTTVGRTVLAGGVAVPTDPLPALTDDHFIVPPRIRHDGLSQYNRVGVRGAGVGKAGDALWGDATDGESRAQHGLLEGDFTESGLADIASVRQAARTRRDTVSRPVTTIQEATLDPDTGIPIDKLVPGALVPIRLVNPCKPVTGTYRLSRLTVSVNTSDAGVTEAVTIMVMPAGTTSDDEEGL